MATSVAAVGAIRPPALNDMFKANRIDLRTARARDGAKHQATIHRRVAGRRALGTGAFYGRSLVPTTGRRRRIRAGRTAAVDVVRCRHPGGVPKTGDCPVQSVSHAHSGQIAHSGRKWDGESRWVFLRGGQVQRESISRRELYEKVWTTPLRRLAPELGLSDVGLAKLCTRHGIPVPPRGYWAKLQHGHRSRRPRLLPGKTVTNSSSWLGHASTDPPAQRWVAPHSSSRSSHRIRPCERKRYAQRSSGDWRLFAKK
jgi:hypothetical protein